MAKINTAVILAAGYGNRMGALTQNLPKPLVPFMGQPMLAHMLERLSQLGIEYFFINGFYLKEKLRAYIASTACASYDIKLVDERELLETGGGVKAMLPQLPSDFIVVNCDNYWDSPASGHDFLQSMILQYNNQKMVGLLGLVAQELAHGYAGAGDFTLIESDIQEIVAPIMRAPDKIFMGVQILNRSAFDLIEEDKFSLNLIYDRLIVKNQLYGMVCPYPWYHIGDPESLCQAAKLLKVLPLGKRD